MWKESVFDNMRNCFQVDGEKVSQIQKVHNSQILLESMEDSIIEDEDVFIRPVERADIESVRELQVC
jgi:hypothetical protein